MSPIPAQKQGFTTPFATRRCWVGVKFSQKREAIGSNHLIVLPTDQTANEGLSRELDSCALQTPWLVMQRPCENHKILGSARKTVT